MKTRIILFCLLFCPFVGNAQLIVNEHGNVGVGMSTMSSNETHTALSVGKTVGGYGASILSKDIGALYISNDTASLRPKYGFNADLVFKEESEVNGIRVWSRGYGNNKLVGIYSIVAGGTNCASYGIGVFGGLNAKSYMTGGVGIYGSTYSSLLNIPNAYYAGYFQGDIRVTGTIYGTVLTPSALSGGSGTSGEESNTEERFEDEPSVTESLQQVELIRMTRMNNDGSLAANKVVEREWTGNNVAEEVEFAEDIDSDSLQTKLSSVSYGLAADQLKEVYPELVYEDKEGNYSINYIEMVPLLVQSIKELSAKVETLEQQLGMQKSAKKSKQQTSAIDKAKDAKPNKKSTTYDLSGRPATNPQRGVYVQDGKKVAIK